MYIDYLFSHFLHMKKRGCAVEKERERKTQEINLSLKLHVWLHHSRGFGRVTREF